jgi:hypothetical protein
MSCTERFLLALESGRSTDLFDLSADAWSVEADEVFA